MTQSLDWKISDTSNDDLYILEYTNLIHLNVWDFWTLFDS